MKTFNFYCDESCHLENDNFPYMLIGYVSSAYNQVKLHTEKIKQLKKDYHIPYELKWNHLSKSAMELYKELIDYFFATDLQYRAIVIDKNQLKHQQFQQTHDDFYYKMYYQLIQKKLSPEYNYNIYLDIKDTRSAQKVNGLKDYLNNNFVSIRNLQNIRSYESELMQLTDIITGALSYYLRKENKVIAKNKIVDRIAQHAGQALNQSSPRSEQKFNLFFIDLK
ncbi:DUF3800 domain-containing protein [Capnocytophaga sp. oral taxon 380]|jgi:hypothetical protein|uniref:DUF3800 domain-containing protein n=1 Tax=Capnocytophaga sp. oral taxon 380 TaxID=712217 RepID=UPI0002A21713|nr:DUF3800 domain-containing protein [Capnocytophaga sp. oral taxon 380]EKY08715.1 hypothetical protein HMPREF9078_00727 [Capnocytophaga sp. oral taxon 380 str. F0488]